ncbi:hypothetical protein [Tahibacter soli]|uniref:Uncharacterized protein n=1 Tax=Tahibacter soli TaxID=2983605 RepID=A0A9X3YM12_9GAMM|nr:hypothetical protein [Tahibacter soli]MDC8014149.1 hypothetical protein [Tahibacter soli]
MHFYFSHSYRDVAVNSYFLEHFVQRDIPLYADQKSAIWCVAKLERYLHETSGFVSIVSRRPSEDDPAAYSRYISQELNLARRARVRRLLFVDEHVLERHTLDFPEDAVSFNPAALDDDRERHLAAISAFQRGTGTAGEQAHRSRPRNQATLVVDDGPANRDLADGVGELLRRERFEVRQIAPTRRTRALDDVRLLETLWRSELCVFVLGARLSNAHVALAMAHAHCIPSVRLQLDPRADNCEPSLTGLIRWRSAEEALIEVRRQLASYRGGFVEPVEIARDSTVADAARSVGTTYWEPTKHDLWNAEDGPGLLHHVRPGDPLVQDQVNRARHGIGKALGTDRSRTFSMLVCRTLYDGLKRHRFVYEIEPRTGHGPGVQQIRPPGLIEQSKAATCIDLACLFAAQIEAAGQNALVLVLEVRQSRHALVGFRALDEPALRSDCGIGELRGALQRGDIVLFEATGAVEADDHGDEPRHDKLLDFMAAKAAAERYMSQDPIRLIHTLDVASLRRPAPYGNPSH